MLRQRVDRGAYVLPCIRFRQACSGAGDQDIANQIVRLMGRKNENFSIGTSLLDLARGNQAIELGQREIENDHIRLEREGQLHRLPTGRRLTTDLPAKMLVENGAQSISTDGAVFGDQDPDHLSAQKSVLTLYPREVGSAPGIRVLRNRPKMFR